MLLTFMAETREETKNRGKHKMLMNHVSYFDGDDKSKCLMWLDNLERIAKEANIPLREAIAAKAGPNILTVLSRHPSAPDAELKRVILENFSNVGTRLEASHYLRRMRLAENKPIVTHNSEYAAVHAVAYNLKPEEQTDQQVFQQYANTLGDHIADKLTRKNLQKGTTLVHKNIERRYGGRRTTRTGLQTNRTGQIRKNQHERNYHIRFS